MLCFPDGISLKALSNININYSLVKTFEKNSHFNNCSIHSIKTKYTYNKTFGDEIMKEMNPDKLLFCFCFKVETNIKKVIINLQIFEFL